MQMIHLLLRAAVTGPASMKVLFLHIRISNRFLCELGSVAARSAATREHHCFSRL